MATKKPRRRSKFAIHAATEDQLTRGVTKVGKGAGWLIRMHMDLKGNIRDPEALSQALMKYDSSVRAWAERAIGAMYRDSQKSDIAAWHEQSASIAKGLRTRRDAILADPELSMARRDAINLIAKMGSTAGDVARARARELAEQASVSGNRAESIVAEMEKTITGITESRARLIARTEIAKANSMINTANAKAAGVTAYIWRTMGDGAVRDTHAELAGSMFNYGQDPDIPGEGVHGPGEFPNCRCYREPVIN